MKRKAAMGEGEGLAGPARRPARPGIQERRGLRRSLAARPQPVKLTASMRLPRLEPGGDAAAGGLEVLQCGLARGRAEEFTGPGQRAGQIGEPGRVTAAGHDAVPGAVPNPAQAEVPGWAEYASSAMVTGPSACALAW